MWNSEVKLWSPNKEVGAKIQTCIQEN